MRNLTLKTLVALAVMAWAGGASPKPVDIKEFVRQAYIHGVPCEKASKYDASVVPTLLKMLQDSKEQAHWSNIVATLGMIGDAGAVEPVIAFIEKIRKGTPNRDQRRAKASAMMALGYLVNKSGNRRALDYLITNLTLPARSEGFFGAMADLFGATAERKLNKYAVMGLAVSGHPRAAKALKSIRESLESSDDRKMIDEALATNEKIADKGLAEYCRTSRS